VVEEPGPGDGIARRRWRSAGRPSIAAEAEGDGLDESDASAPPPAFAALRAEPEVEEFVSMLSSFEHEPPFRPRRNPRGCGRPLPSRSRWRWPR
jgi:hypothetical protein